MRRGASHSRLQNTSEAFLMMPRPCAVEPHASSYQKGPRNDATALCRGGSRSQLQKGLRNGLADATALRRGGSRSQLQKGLRKGLEDAAALRRGASRFLMKLKCQLPRALSVKLHGARPWHLSRMSRRFCSRDRETPRHKAVASLENVAAFCSRDRETPRCKTVASPKVLSIFPPSDLPK